MTVKDKIKEIDSQDRKFHQIYIVQIESKKSTVGRYEYQFTGIRYCKNQELEMDKEVIDCVQEKEESIEFSLSGKSWTSYYYSYTIYVNKLAKGNKGRYVNTTREVVEKKGRFVL